jgi:hypothetical protein
MYLLKGVGNKQFSRRKWSLYVSTEEVHSRLPFQWQDKWTGADFVLASELLLWRRSVALVTRGPGRSTAKSKITDASGSSCLD